ncbi:MAG: acyltransferase [Pseudomonadota bacterium]
MSTKNILNDDGAAPIRLDQRLYELDFIRFTAALMVVFFHYTFRAFITGDYTAVRYDALSVISKYGYLGVNLFFIISGFVIVMTALDRDWRQFLVSRLVRLYPAYWAAIIATTVAILSFGDAHFSISLKKFLVNFTMFQEWVGVDSIDGVYWTLMIEMKFYLMVLVVIFAKKMDRLPKLLLGWLLISALYLLFPHTKFGYILDAIFIARWSPYFIAGVALFLIWRKGDSVLLWSMVVCAYVFALAGADSERFAYMQRYRSELDRDIVSGMISAFFIFLAIVARRKMTFPKSRLLIAAGAVTYPLYLCHQYIGYMALNMFESYFNKYVLLILVFTISLLLAYSLHRFVERPFAPLLKTKLNALLKIKKSAN